jgi:uncharacterized protein YpmB
MGIKKKWKYFFATIIILLLAVCSIFLLIFFAPKPPVSEVESARISVSLASSSEAATYSRRLFNEATAFYDSAMIHWQKENKRFMLFRDFSRVREFAAGSEQKAREAVENSKISASILEVNIRGKIDSLNNLTVYFDRIFKAYPLPPEIWTRISKGKLLLRESEIAYSKGQYFLANRKIIDSEYLLTASYDVASQDLKEYFEDYSRWQKWVDKTIKESRQNKNCSLIIDKFSRKCFVYISGQKKYEYSVELGTNWVGHKKIMGDKATPEGMYCVTKKLGNNNTKYYKALLIDYPNASDKAEFKKELARGTLPKNAKLGGMIEIHGNGGKGIDWTEGCVALSDSEMDVLFKLVKEGTPVTIVGSTLKLEQLID